MSGATFAIREETGFPTFDVLGVRIDAVQIPDAVAILKRWAEDKDRARYVAVTGMHGVTVAQEDPAVMRALREADLVVADGMPIVWLGRRQGHDLPRRVYGPEMMVEVLKTAGTGSKHFLFGATDQVLQLMAHRMHSEFGMEVVGMVAPPFRPLTSEERSNVIAEMNESDAAFVWVGLSTPKQELWMKDVVGDLKPKVLIGVGAAFDFLTGTKKTAPRWMQEHGFEWLHRLSREPRRLWRRYLNGGAKFGVSLLKEELGGRKANAKQDH